MLIFLYGEDTFRSRQKLNQIVGQYSTIHTSGFNIQRIDCEGLDFFDLKGKLQTHSLFAEKKLFILTNVFSNANLLKSLHENKNILEHVDGTIIFFEEGSPKANNPLFAFLKKEAKAQEFSFLKPLQVQQWIGQEFQKYHVQVEPRAVEALALHIGNDLWRLAQEIKKLAAFAQSNNSRVGVQDVQKFSKAVLEADIFATIDEVAKKNKKAALESIARHLEKKESALYILSMLAFQFRNLLVLKDLENRRVPYERMALKAKLHPFVVKKGTMINQKFAFSDLKRIYRSLLEFDFLTKQGRIAPEMSLYLFITQL